MSELGVVEQYWTGVAGRLQIEADVLNRLVGHNGEMGRANELALAQLVGRFLPSAVGVGTGIIIDSDGRRSSQIDIIVYDRSSQPQVLNQSAQLLFPVETVLAAIEVKTTVDAAAIVDAASKIRSVRALKPRGSKASPCTVLFGYSVGGNPAARVSELNALASDGRPDVSCVLNPGIASISEGDQRVAGLVPLHAVDAAGARRSRIWYEVTEHGSAVVRNGHAYPISRLELRGAKYAFDPGRALLLFASELNERIGRSVAGESEWLSFYLPNIAREVVVPTDAQG